jgi:hypothetical protein
MVNYDTLFEIFRDYGYFEIINNTIHKISRYRKKMGINCIQF